MKDKMSLETYQSIKALVDYLYADEQRHYQELKNPKKHIFRDVVRVSNWIGGVAGDYDGDAR